jgi:TatD DNase family protein
LIFDMHCHLDLYPNPGEVASLCREKGLYMLSVTTTPKAWHGTVNLAKGNNKIRTALGLHPQLAHQRYNELELFEELLPLTRYVGEVGLDGGFQSKIHWKIQLKVFRHILQKVSNAGGRIMSIHSRSSAGAVLSELSANLPGIAILHWFTGNKAELKNAIDLGCWFSVGPAMLATKKGQELVSLMPINRVLTETDGPFSKIDQQVLMPWDVTKTFEKLSLIWNMGHLEVQERLQRNFKELLSFNQLMVVGK